MLMEKVKSTLLKCDSYPEDELRDIAGDFQGKHITESSYEGNDMRSVVGVIDESEYIEGEGIVVEGTIYGDEIIDKIKEGFDLVPRLLSDASNGRIVGGDGVFLSLQKEASVGETEVIG